MSAETVTPFISLLLRATKERIDREEVKGIERYRQDDRPPVAGLSYCGQNVSSWSRQNLGVTFQQIQKYENGRNRLSGSRVIQAAAALNVMPGDILGDNNGTGDNHGHDRFSALAEPAVNLMVRAMMKLPVHQRKATARAMTNLIEAFTPRMATR